MKTTDKFSLYAIKRAWFATIGFFLWSVNVLIYIPIHWLSSWPVVSFHLLMLINTFFSIRVFASITPPRHIGQQFIDIILGLCYIFIPLTFNYPLIFMMLNLLLFILATIKYIFLISIVGFSKLLYEKIRIDTLGILLCFLALFGILYDFSYVSLLSSAVIFLLATIYIFYIKPLYKLENHYLE